MDFWVIGPANFHFMLRYLNGNILDLVPMHNLQMIFTDSDQTELIAQSLVFKIDDPDFALPKHTIAKIKDHCRGTPISIALYRVKTSKLDCSALYTVK